MGPVDEVKIQISVVLGRAKMPINQLLRMGRGAVIELDATEQDDVDILANNVPVARGEVTIRNDRVAVTVNEVLPSTARRRALQAKPAEAAGPPGPATLEAE
jgi:flagellar motor switch protein FliN/FliY